MEFRKNIFRSLIFSAIFLIPFLLYGQGKKDKWDIADSLTVRLIPSKFDKLPENIVQYLENKGFTIPQCECNSKLHNVISGSFGKKDKLDWAVLASRDRISRILIFWDGSTKNPSAIAKVADRIYLQSSGDEIIFSRVISPVGKETIFRLYHAFGGPKPPKIKHLGIDDMFTYKASTIHYFYKGQ